MIVWGSRPFTWSDSRWSWWTDASVGIVMGMYLSLKFSTVEIVETQGHAPCSERMRRDMCFNALDLAKIFGGSLSYRAIF